MFHTNLSLRDLIHRLSRIVSSEAWSDDLNPTQRAALDYLARANRFSRSPSHVADYLCATRGTVSQTLKSLARKDLVREVRSQTDRRSITYELTSRGYAHAQSATALDDALKALPDTTSESLSGDLKTLLQELLAQREGRSFGICQTCKHHQVRGKGGWCILLKVDLAPVEVTQLCHEHEFAA